MLGCSPQVMRGLGVLMIRGSALNSQIPIGQWEAGDRNRSGQMLVVVAFALVIILAMVGLVSDAGRVQCSRRHAQRAADAAAQAGARKLLFGTGGTNDTAAIQSATFYAMQNMVLSNNVSVEIPPATSAYFNGSNGHVRVRVILDVNTTLMRLFLPQRSVPVAAFATAGIRSTPYGVRLLVLKGAGSGAFTMTGTALIDIGDGTMHVNSSDGSALRKVGSGDINAGCVKVVGGISEVGSGHINATIVTGADVEPDPLASLPAPNFANYPVSLDSGGTSTKPGLKMVTGSSPYTLRPGIYYGGLKITGSGNITMQPGAYIMAGGGFTMTGSGTLTGTDIFIYNTRDPYKTTGAGAYGDIDLTGSGARDLRAPDAAHDPTYKGILIFNDRAAGNTTKIKLAGSGSLGGAPPIRGYVYNPNGELWITGSGDMGSLGGIVNTMTVNGSATFSDLDSERAPGSNSVRLVE